MKKILLATGTILFLVTGLSAQNERRPNRERMPVKDRVERMAKSLELTDKQKEELTTFYTELEKQAREAVNDANEAREARRERMEARMKETNEKLKSILGDEKFEKWQSMRPNRQERSQAPFAEPLQGDPQRGPAPNMGRHFGERTMFLQQRPNRQRQETLTPEQQAERMTKQLSLTAEQQTALVKYYTDLKTRRDNARTNTQETREDRRARMQKEREAESAKLEKIIGKAKMEELQKIREQNRGNRNQ